MFQEISEDSSLQRLDPRSKLCSLILLSAASIFAIDPVALSPLVALGILGISLSGVIRVGDRENRRLLALITIGVALLISLNGLFANVNVSDPRVLFTIPLGRVEYRITPSGLYFGVGAACRYVTMFLLFISFVVTTYPRDLANSLEQIGFPYQLTFVMALGFRFASLLEDQVGEIMTAIRSRRGRAFRDIPKATDPLAQLRLIAKLIILRQLSLVEDASLVLQARCFGATPRRTSRRRYEFRIPDYAVTILSLFLFFAYLLGRLVWGFGAL